VLEVGCDLLDDVGHVLEGKEAVCFSEVPVEKRTHGGSLLGLGGGRLSGSHPPLGLVRGDGVEDALGHF
jgi:hypothetical protein